ncbi:MAG: 50S ribosomal protein L30 [Thermoplasmatota archaeon]
MFLAIRVRGTVKLPGEVTDTLTMLRLHRPNSATFVPKDASHLGMIRKVKEWIAYGEVDAATAGEILKQRGRLEGDKPITDEYVKTATQGKYATIAAFAEGLAKGEASLKELPSMKAFFRLHPPRGGHDGSVKHHHKVGGALAYYGPSVNDLARRML